MAKRKRITASELAKNASKILDGVELRGERFVVERRGKVVGELRPAKPEPRMTDEQVREVLAAGGSITKEQGDRMRENVRRIRESWM